MAQEQEYAASGREMENYTGLNQPKVASQ